jgi:uncharacterized protein YndB with AHSA1/START domain
VEQQDPEGVTGVATEVEYVTDVPVERVWELITEIGRIGEWSPETAWAAWRPGDAPRPGARFDARNDFGPGESFPVECVVTAAERPAVFEWVVLDDDRDVERPGSVWRYELEPAGAGTLVRHRFSHGPGLTGLREGVRQDPDRAEVVVAHRLARLRENMTRTLDAMTGSER